MIQPKQNPQLFHASTLTAKGMQRQTPSLHFGPVFLPCFPAWMNYDSMVEEFFPPGSSRREANALMPHRLLRFTPKCERAALTTTFSSGMKPKTPSVQPALSQPANFPANTGTNGRAQGSNRSQ
jgi:hypothetical protein